MSKGDKTQGKRVYLTEQNSFPVELGEYGRNPVDNEWYFRPPVKGISVGRLTNHNIVEHKDGTITVSPSILIDGSKGKQWHGYLEKGVWREV